MKNDGKAKATRDRPTMAAVDDVPLNNAAMMPNRTPPVIQRQNAAIASETETGILSLRRELTVWP